MTPPVTWYLVRHGETEWNAISRMQGQLDSRLTPRGREHAESTARLLARLGVDRLFASPLGRVRETLAVLADASLPLPTFDDRLKEWSGGDWSGELYADIATRWPSDFEAWVADRYHYRPPGGGNVIDVGDRARAFLAEVLPAAGERIALVGHGFMNRALAQVLLSLSPTEVLRIRQANDVVIRVVDDGLRPTADHFVSGD